MGTDVARFSTNGEEKHYVNILGLGFITDVLEAGLKIKFLGNFSYTLAVLYQMIFLKKFKMRIEADGKLFEGKNIFIEVSNTRYTSNFLMAPEASFDDGYLDVTILNPVSRLRMLGYFPSIFSGKHIYKKEVKTFKAKKIRIETEVPVSLSPDGELMGKTPVVIECLHQAIPVYRP